MLIVNEIAQILMKRHFLMTESPRFDMQIRYPSFQIYVATKLLPISQYPSLKIIYFEKKVTNRIISIYVVTYYWFSIFFFAEIGFVSKMTYIENQ